MKQQKTPPKRGFFAWLAAMATCLTSLLATICIQQPLREPKAPQQLQAELLLHGTLEHAVHFFTVLLRHLQSSLRIALGLVCSVHSL